MTDNKEFYLFRRIPAVLRARGFRLYLSGGKRLVDLWLNGGAAVLGHTPSNMLRELKNTASRGLYAPFPHFTEGRFIKALSKIFPGRNFRLYAALPQELLHDVKLWRPFNDSAAPFEADDTPYLVPVISGIQTWRDGLPLGLCVIAAKSENLLARLPSGDPLSPVLLAIAARGIYDLLASPQRTKPTLSRVMKFLQNSRWQRRGIYLTLTKNANNEEWEKLFYQFLEAGFLLPPTPAYPLILPGELSGGEEVKLAEVLG